MNQSELIEKVAQATELNQAAAGQAVKAVVNVILDGLLAGEAVRVSGLGSFNVAARPARQGRNPQTGETIEIAASKAVRFHAGKAVKDASIRRLGRGLPGRSPHHERNPRSGSETSCRCAGGPGPRQVLSATAAGRAWDLVRSPLCRYRETVMAWGRRSVRSRRARSIQAFRARASADRAGPRAPHGRSMSARRKGLI